MDKDISTYRFSADEEHKLAYNEINRVRSNLPDDILITILHSLTMKEAARLSGLSHDWKLWWSCYPRLIFDGTKILRLLRQKWEDDESMKKLRVETVKFVHWVNQVVKSHQGPTIEEFRVRFYLDKRDSVDIDTWLNFALGKKVKMLELAFQFAENIGSPQVYRFPPICDTNAQVHLGCNSLMLLRLVLVDITKEALQSILSSCKSLEKLYLIWSNLPIDVKIVGQSLKLKHLELDHCFGVKNIDISAIHLVSFKCVNSKINVLWKDVPRLESLTLEDTFVEADPRKIRDLIHLPKVEHLKHLHMKINFTGNESLLGLIYLIQACPFLRSFVLELHYRIFEEWDPEEIPFVMKPQWTKRSNNHLKIIEFSGFIGDVDIDLELATYVIESSNMPEKVTFDTRSPKGIPWETDGEVRETARECARQLGKKLPKETSCEII